VDFQTETVVLPIFSLSGCWGTYVPASVDEMLHPLGLCDLATVGECPETVPAYPFICQHNLKILYIRMFCLSEQYSALSALLVNGVKDAVKQFL